MTSSNDSTGTDEIAEFAARLRTVDDPKWAVLADSSREDIARLMEDMKSGGEQVSMQIASLCLLFSNSYRRLVPIIRWGAMVRYVLGGTDAAPAEQTAAESAVTLPTNPGAVVRAGMDEMYVRDACGIWIGEHGTVAVSDDAMRAHAAVRLEVLSEGVRAAS